MYTYHNESEIVKTENEHVICNNSYLAFDPAFQLQCVCQAAVYLNQADSLRG